MAVNVKMGVDIGSFKQGIQEGQNILKGLNAEMKATERQVRELSLIHISEPTRP